MGNVSDFHRAAKATQGRRVWCTGEVAADSNVEDHVLWGRGKRVPDVLVVDAAASDLHELLAVPVPGDRLARPGGGGAIDDDAPSVPSVVCDGGASADTVELVADATGRDVAVDGAVACRPAVDCLENVDLTALGPWRAVADRVTEEPEGGPDALLVGLRVAAKADLGLDYGPPTVRGREDVLGLQTGRCPGSVVELRHDLECATTRELMVSARPRIRLPLVVGVLRAHKDVPVPLVHQRTSRAVEVLLPDNIVSAITRYGLSRDGRHRQGEGEQLRKHDQICMYVYTMKGTDMYGACNRRKQSRQGQRDEQL